MQKFTTNILNFAHMYILADDRKGISKDTVANHKLRLVIELHFLGKACNLVYLVNTILFPFSPFILHYDPKWNMR